MMQEKNKNIPEIIPGCTVAPNGTLFSPNGNDYNHIESVKVIICNNDSYFIDEEWSFATRHGLYQHLKYIDHKPGYRYRSRYEPALEIILKEENGPLRWKLTISHHKGSISVDTERLT